MDGLQKILVVLLAIVSCSHDPVCASVLEVTVRPGDNITLYCDCKVSFRVYAVWFRNCSHKKQPSLVLNVRNYFHLQETFSRFNPKKNDSSGSYDLVIMNATDSDEGLYYCGTEEVINLKTIYRYSSRTTRLTVNSGGLHPANKAPPQDCAVCWKLLFSLCPAVFVLSALLSSFLVYLICQKTVAAQKCQDEERKHNTLRQTDETQGEDLYYAAMEICPASQRPKKTRTVQSSDFCTYSAINTIQM